MKKVIILTLLAGVSLLPSGAWGEEEWLTYKSKPVEGVTYSIRYPPSWELKEMSPFSVGIMCFDDPKLKTMVTLSIQDVRLLGYKTVTLDEYLKIRDQNILRTVFDYKHSVREKVSLGGEEAVLTAYAYTDKKDPQWHVKGESYTLLVNETLGYEIGYGSTPESYDKFSETAQKIINSFKFE